MIEMTKRYKNLILRCILLSALFVVLVALPKHWYVKLEMTQREYETALVEASDEMLNAKGQSERQLAMRRVTRLNNLQASGQIDTVSDLTWILNGMRFLLIATILTLCWIISKRVYRYAAHLKDAKESSAAKS